MIWPWSLRALVRVLVTQGLVSSAQDLPACQDLAPYERGRCYMTDQQELSCPKSMNFQKSTRSPSACNQECSTATYTKSGQYGIYWNRTCHCNNPTDCPQILPATCNAPGECSVPECTGDGKTVVCQEDKCACNDGGTGTTPPATCSADADCSSISDCEGAGKDKVCQKGKCFCKTPATPLVCSANEECAALPDCEGMRRKKICQHAACVCKSEGEVVVSTTVTALPPRASIETITAHVTENMVTTTTSPGSDESTVVPIIVSLGKPPVICWGCVPLPANIQLKLSEFCDQFLGFKVGNCPSQNDENTKEEEKKEEEDKDEEKKTTCSTNATTTYASVFCTVTREPGQPERRKRDEGCSTLNYETKTACETMAGSTARTTTTLKPEPTICSPGTCGGGVCTLEGRGLAKRAPPGLKGQPNASSWFGPEHYDNNFEFMRREVYKAYQDPSSSVNL